MAEYVRNIDEALRNVRIGKISYEMGMGAEPVVATYTAVAGDVCFPVLDGLSVVEHLEAFSDSPQNALDNLRQLVCDRVEAWEAYRLTEEANE